MPYYISPPPSSPVARLIGAIVAVLATAGAIMLGLAAFLVILGVGLVLGVGLWLRVTWLRRRMRRQDGDVKEQQTGHSDEVIEAEYTVVSRDRE